MSFAKHLLTLGLAASATGLLSCSISKPECTVGQTSTNGVGLTGASAFAVRYVLKTGSGECANFKGEMVGLQSYHPSNGKSPPERDFGKTTVAIRTQSLGELAWMTEDLGVAGDPVTPNSLGDFAALDPDADDMCEVKTFTPAQVVFPGTTFDSDAHLYVDDPTTVPDTCAADADCAAAPGAICRLPDGYCAVPVDLPATDLTYEWSNVHVLVTAAATGTQFSADVKITLNGCVAEYTAIGLWPSVDCTSIDPAATTPGSDSLCDPNADPEHGRPVGSGINPDFGPVACDADVAVVPVVDAWYSIPDVGGFPLSVPRCVITQDKIPALSGAKSSTSTASQ